ncbi:class I SAM-dependent methyltransferase [Halobacillus litoralis]|uniref:class I SAM-dependent methyltransferase n=1 Tax=Halobacillus litoralis TaxID=45668 RepID=UPI001CD5FC20|nr:class I SAM-dependent methyltransferase [Halobacillus litoralis]MCA0972472.1 class I SAM-dependent methyltransferase [Halobacillus litoralis]
MTDEQKNKVRQTFSKNKEAYVTSSTHRSKSDLEQVTAWLQPQPSWKALDIATGGGHVAKELSRSAGMVFATDLTKDMLQNTARHLQDQSNIHYVVADAEELPFIDETFDVVTCRIAAHHFPNPSAFIQEVSRVLRPKGKFLLIDNVAPEKDELDTFYNTFEKMRDSSHVRALKISEWEKLLRDDQLPIVRSETRKKKLPYRDWLERTQDDTDQQKAIDEYFKQASPEQHTYFQYDDSLTSFSIDEWVVLSQKN